MRSVILLKARIINKNSPEPAKAGVYPRIDLRGKI